MPATIRFTPEFIKSCEELWRDGFNKGVNGEDDYPDFKTFFSGKENKIKEEPSYAELEQKPFDSSKCEARVEKFGYAIQCTRSPFGGGCLCKTHQNMLDKLPEGKDIRYGRFNQPRPDKTLDKGEPIKWGPKKTRNKDSSKTEVKPKLKMPEMRDYLVNHIPSEDFRGLKKKELTELYLKVKERENASPKSSSSEEENTEDQTETRVQESTSEEQLEEQPKESTSEEKPEEQLEEPIAEVEEKHSEEQPEEKPEQPEEKPEQPEEKPEEKPEEPISEVEEKHPEEQHEEQPEEKQEKVEDDGKGTGLKLEPYKPNSIREYKELFDKLGLDYSNLKGRRAYSQAYDDYLREQEDEKTQPMSSDDEDDDELQEDTNSYDEISYEGVSYLEDEDSGKIYNLKHQCVAKWNSDSDEFIWESDECKNAHENECN